VGQSIFSTTLMPSIFATCLHFSQYHIILAAIKRTIIGHITAKHTPTVLSIPLNQKHDFEIIHPFRTIQNTAKRVTNGVLAISSSINTSTGPLLWSTMATQSDYQAPLVPLEGRTFAVLHYCLSAQVVSTCTLCNHSRT
jgi:hypothetical protein